MTTIPKLTKIPGLTPEVSQFLDALKAKGFKGDIQTDYATRLVNATDNSVYQIIPQAVVAPKSSADVETLTQLLGQAEHRKVTVSPRGGGTGTNGQSLSPGVIVDLSRHMNRILDLDKEAGWVRVQPGVVLDQVNAYLKPHGLFFAPSVSPSSRATLGGMIATDACGKGSRVYGKTSGHIVELSLVLPDGTTWVSHELSELELSVQKGRDDRIGEVLRVVDDIVTEKKELIKEQFPKIPRFLTGYNLAHVRKDAGQFTLNPIVSGAEGTLAFVTEAKLRVLPIPPHKSLIAIRYATFDDALRAAEVLVAADPGAIETVDDTIVNLAKKDAIWDKVSHLLREEEGAPPTAAVNLVEFSGTNQDQVAGKVTELVRVLNQKRGEPGEAIGYMIAPTQADIAALWELRKKGVGLLGNAPGERRPIAFVEDTAVHPKDLAAFIREFRAILDGAGLRYGMFGHVDAGCLHVRPALNTRDPADEQLLREISDKVVALVRKYGGVMWSEHGKGFRSEYSPQFFGEELFGDLCKIKRAFDPYNQLNPGKLAVPAESGAKLVSVDALKRGEFDRMISPKSLVRYATSVNCNGNGACFDYSADSVMCPSSKVTRDRIHSPKGRAGMMREWLRQLSEEGYDAAAEFEGPSHVGLPKPPPNPLGKDLALVDPTYDFSHEVYSAMDGCLACKACATQCPVKVDVPELKSEFLHLYHKRYPRPAKDLFAAALEFVVVWMAWFPRLVNMMLNWGLVKSFVEHVVGIVDAPKLAKLSLKAGLLARNAPAFDFERLERLSDEEREQSVVLIQDAFHGFYDTHVTLAAYDLMTKLGFTVYVAPYRPSGKALHVKGFLDAFRKTARGNIEFFRKVAEHEVPMVCIDPAVTLAFRDEYSHVVKEPLNYHIHLFQEWLSERGESITKLLATHADRARDTLNTGTSFHYVLMGHCTERTAAPATQRQWVEVFERFGVQLKLESVGCCGMCGMYGHEAAHYKESRGIFAMSWERHLPDDPKNLSRYLAPGYSCRSQVKRFSTSRRTLKHPVEVMLELTKG